MASYNGNSSREDYLMAVESEPVQVLVRDNIRGVYPVGRDAWENEVNEGLAFIKELLENYEQMRIPLDELHFSVIFHSKASYVVLNDDAYKRYTGKDEPNPNRNLIRELTEKGVSIEICSISMGKFKFRREDLLPEVTVVFSTFSRTIDLEMQGYAFIQF